MFRIIASAVPTAIDRGVADAPDTGIAIVIEKPTGCRVMCGHSLQIKLLPVPIGTY